jgi:hypothetical protein
MTKLRIYKPEVNYYYNVILILLVQFIFTFNVSGQSLKKWPKVNMDAGNICMSEPYKLVFSDEFDGTVLDTAKWYTYYPYGPASAPDSCSFCRTHVSANIYRDENAIVENGMLRLKSDAEKGEWFGRNFNYTSALVYSKQFFNTYGKYEIRCKLPKGKQQWPAFWVFGWSTEIDVFEFICKGPEKVEFTIHYWNSDNCIYKKNTKGGPCVSNRSGVVDFGIDFSEDFHTFSVEYEPNMVKFYVDDIMVRYVPKYFDNKGNPITRCEISSGEYRVNPAFPIQGQPVHVIANQLICQRHKEKNPVYPNFMEVDYIRVYQKQIQSGLNEIILP